MFITCWSVNHGNNVIYDYYNLHDTESQAIKDYNHILNSVENLFCASVSKVKHATEPHWMEKTA